MICPKCGLDQSKVIDSRSAAGGKLRRRRHVCGSCGFRFSTLEITVPEGHTPIFEQDSELIMAIVEDRNFLNLVRNIRHMVEEHSNTQGRV